jgi:hypothetical protein
MDCIQTSLYLMSHLRQISIFNKTLFSGRLHFSMGLMDEALDFLQQGLESAQASGKREDEAKIRHQVTSS